MKQIFPSIISEDILNFVAFQLLHCFLQIYLICCLKMKIHEVRKNFMRFGSTSVCLFSYHSVFILMGYLNIACQLFKNLTVEAHMENYLTLLFGRGNLSQFYYGSPLCYRRGERQTKTGQIWMVGGIKIFNYGCHKSTTPIIASIIAS